jgi:glycosyltransferase involved in cell wall biosynthesis
MAGNSTLSEPKVSCLMITADRKKLAKRSLLSYGRQTYQNKELIIIDDGDEDYSPLFEALSLSKVQYIKLKKKPENVLGYLRNISLEAATGEFITQWDDDDWYHPDRIQTQVELLLEGNDACCLSNTIMHINQMPYFHHPFISLFKKGTPGSIMHRKNSDIRYPGLRRGEDDVYLRFWAKKRYVKLPVSYAHLMIRCFHGSNTWEQKHFHEQMINTFTDRVTYGWYRIVERDIFKHRRFKLSEKAVAAFELYLNDSQEAGIFQTSSL